MNGYFVDNLQNTIIKNRKQVRTAIKALNDITVGRPFGVDKPQLDQIELIIRLAENLDQNLTDLNSRWRMMDDLPEANKVCVLVRGETQKGKHRHGHCGFYYDGLFVDQDGAPFDCCELTGWRLYPGYDD